MLYFRKIVFLTLACLERSSLRLSSADGVCVTQLLKVSEDGISNWGSLRCILMLSYFFSHLFPPPSPIFAGGANDRWVRSVSFSPDGRHIASITDDRYGTVSFVILNLSCFNTQHATQRFSARLIRLCSMECPRNGLHSSGNAELSIEMTSSQRQGLCTAVPARMTQAYIGVSPLCHDPPNVFN